MDGNVLSFRKEPCLNVGYFRLPAKAAGVRCAPEPRTETVASRDGKKEKRGTGCVGMKTG